MADETVFGDNSATFSMMRGRIDIESSGLDEAIKKYERLLELQQQYERAGGQPGVGGMAPAPATTGQRNDDTMKNQIVVTTDAIRENTSKLNEIAAMLGQLSSQLESMNH